MKKFESKNKYFKENKSFSPEKVAEDDLATLQDLNIKYQQFMTETQKYQEQFKNKFLNQIVVLKDGFKPYYYMGSKKKVASLKRGEYCVSAVWMPWESMYDTRMGNYPRLDMYKLNSFVPWERTETNLIATIDDVLLIGETLRERKERADVELYKFHQHRRSKFEDVKYCLTSDQRKSIMTMFGWESWDIENIRTEEELDNFINMSKLV